MIYMIMENLWVIFFGLVAIKLAAFLAIELYVKYGR